MTARPRQDWYEVAFGPHYPLLYAHRDQAEARRCLALLPRLAPLGEGPLLDLGCGQGRHLSELAPRSGTVVGLDISRPLLLLARQAAPAAHLVRADMRRLPLRAECCSAVLSLFTSFGYFGAVFRHRPLVREIARVLHRGGHWFLDFLDSERVAAELADGPRTSSRDLGVLLVEEQRRLAARPRRVVKTLSIEAGIGQQAAAAALGIGPQGLRYVEEVTLLSLEQLEELAAAAGLRLAAAAGDYMGGPLVPGASERWLLVFRRADRRNDNA